MERIINHRHYGRSKKLQYLVKWLNYPEADNTWEPADQIHAPELIKSYHRHTPLSRIKTLTASKETTCPDTPKSTSSPLQSPRNTTSSLNLPRNRSDHTSQPRPTSNSSLKKTPDTSSFTSLTDTPPVSTACTVTTRSLTHFILASGLSNTLYDWTVVTLNESSTLRFVSTPYESHSL